MVNVAPSSTRLLLTCAVGPNPRPIQYTERLMKAYALKTKADFVVVRDLYSHLDEEGKALIDRIQVGRNNNKAYLLKILLVKFYLSHYDQILWVDDTCFITKHCDDIFAQATDDMSVAGYNEGIHAEFDSHQTDSTIIFHHTRFSIDRLSYMNTGVMLYNKGLSRIITAATIEKYQVLLKSPFPQQCFLNYIFQKLRVNLVFLPEAYNRVLLDCEFNVEGAWRRPEEISKEYLLEDKHCILHVTGFYRRREDIIKYIGSVLDNTIK